VDHTLRLIKHNWVVLAYNFNIVILVLIIGESDIGALLLILLLQFYPCYYLALSFLFLHLLSTNHKCTQPCYFLLLLKPAAQKERMVWNSSMRSFRLCVALVVIPVVLWSLLLFRSTEGHHSL
jgi:hypothetical protein